MAFRWEEACCGDCPPDNKSACRDYFESFKTTAPNEYEKQEICDVNKNRLRLFVRYDVYPYYPIGPIYYFGLGLTPFSQRKFPFSFAFGAMLPLKQNFLSLDWRVDFSDIYRPYDVVLIHNLSIGYNFRLGYKKTRFRESHMRQEGKSKPWRLF